MSLKKPKVIVILGPTATGKSDLAVDMALAFNGEVISADSRQVYKGLNIGTGKITKKEMKGVPHYLLDICSPKKVFSVSDFQKQALKAIEDIIGLGKVPIICGGTGFYIQSIVDGMVLPEVEPNKELRKKLSTYTPEKLYKILVKLDPQRAKTIDPHNSVRLIRAIEISKAIGKVPPLKKHNKFNVLQIGLDMPDKILKDKIYTRLIKRIKTGMLKEAKRLHDDGLSWKRMEALGLEYKYEALYLQNKISKEEMLERLNFDIWHYVKRQRAWFRKDDRIQWFNPTRKSDIKKIQKEIKIFLK